MNDASPDQNPTPILNRKIALEFLDGDTELLDEMLDLFQDETPRVLSDLKQSVSSQDWDDACRHAHTLKGMAGQIGALRMQSSALDLETLFRGVFHLDDIPSLLNRLEWDTEEVVTLIRSESRL